jgi:hypothetical protein
VSIHVSQSNDEDRVKCKTDAFVVKRKVSVVAGVAGDTHCIYPQSSRIRRVLR